MPSGSSRYIISYVCLHVCACKYVSICMYVTVCQYVHVISCNYLYIYIHLGQIVYHVQSVKTSVYIQHRRKSPVHELWPVLLASLPRVAVDAVICESKVFQGLKDPRGLASQVGEGWFIALPFILGVSLGTGQVPVACPVRPRLYKAEKVAFIDHLFTAANRVLEPFARFNEHHAWISTKSGRTTRPGRTL